MLLRSRRYSRPLFLALAALLIATTSMAEAAPKRAQAKTRMQSEGRGKGRANAKTLAKARAKARAAARAEERAKAEAAAIAAGTAAVFPFQGNETEPLRRQVIRMLKANGMSINISLRAPDTPEQYREMAAALNLAIYVHGSIKDTAPGRATATIVFRSGVTGRPIATASFRGPRNGLGSDIEAGLWDRVRRPLARACIGAKPGRRYNAMQIEAGTPIEDSPR